MENRLKEEEWDYEVEVTDLKTVDTFGRILGSKKATVDTSTGDILGVVSPYYKLYQNKTLFDTMKEIGDQLNLSLNAITVCRNRGATIFQYKFGDAQNKIVSTSLEPNDKIQFGIELINSFDSRWGSTRFRAFAKRLVCLNGMVVPRDIANFSLKGMNPHLIENELTKRITPICNTVNIWETWTKIIPSRIKVGEFISGNLSKEASKVMLEKYDTNVDKSIWGLYNLITFYISHEITTENPSNLRFRQYQLENVASKLYSEELV